jgi:DNA-binding MarR family transcriptional regulator
MSDSISGRGSDPDAPHPTQELDDVVHHRSRLGILAVLREVDRADFGYLRDALGLTDGNLSRHLRTLEAAGHIQVRKGYQGKRPRTWLRLTAQGTKALDQELAALRALVTRLDRTEDRATGPPHRPQPAQT